VAGYPQLMHGTSEPDVEVDPQVARSREAGYTGETGAEAREDR
jgi:hypothetical protein